MSFDFFLEFHNSLHNKNYIQHMKIKAMSWGYYISSPLILNTILGVIFILSSLAHSRTWGLMSSNEMGSYPSYHSE